MSPITGPARFPDELVIEIFRNRELSPFDLAKCARVSRRYLEPVQKLMYQRVPVEMISSPGVDESFTYSEDTWRVLRTLKEREDLAVYVRELAFINTDLETARMIGIVGSLVETTPLLALSTFLRIAQNVRMVGLGWSMEEDVEPLVIIEAYKGVTELNLCDVGEAPTRYLFQQFQHLTHLEIARFDNPHSWMEIGYDWTFHSLRYFDIGNLNLPYDFLPSLSSGSESLQTLRINLDTALDLDFSKFPRLSTLHLHQTGPENDRIEVLSFSWWKNLSRAPALRTLSLRGPQYRGVHELYVFDRALAANASMSVPFPAIKELRFEGRDVVLDRLYALLRTPINRSLERVVISHLYLPIERRKLDAVIKICELFGVEVFF